MQNQRGGIYMKSVARETLGQLLICVMNAISLCCAHLKPPSNTACKMQNQLKDTLVLY